MSVGTIFWSSSGTLCLIKDIKDLFDVKHSKSHDFWHAVSMPKLKSMNGVLNP